MLISPQTYGSYTLIKRYDAHNNYIDSTIKQRDDIVTTVKDPSLTIEDYLKIQGQELDKNYNWHTDLLILALFLDVTFKSGYSMVAPYTHASQPAGAIRKSTQPRENGLMTWSDNSTRLSNQQTPSLMSLRSNWLKSSLKTFHLTNQS